MRNFVYTAWLQDSSLSSDEQDFEFPACFRIAAPTEEAASEWGDLLARGLCGRRPEITFLKSSTEPADPDDPAVASLPSIAHGQVADDSEIGW